MPNDSAAKSRSSSSRAKNTPAIGALNVAAMPEAAPHATSVRTLVSDRWAIWATLEPSAEPIWTIGPSRPTEPPEPIVIAEARDLITATLPAIFPPRWEIASITSGTPWPRASWAQRWTIGP